MNTPVAYLNGQIVPIDDAKLHVFDLGIVGGTSVTEMVRTFRHVPFRLEQHLDRLDNSLSVVGFETGLSRADWLRISQQVVGENSRLISEYEDLGIILFVTAGVNLTYVGRSAAAKTCGPTVCVHTFPLPFELWADPIVTGVSLVTVQTRSIPDDVIDARVKHRSRLHWHLASRQAKSIDPNATAILTDDAGHLTETAAGNLCLVDGTTIVTPARNVLEGVSREYVAELSRSLGFEFIHAAVSPDDLARADEAFLTSTPSCLLPVTRFNGMTIGSGQPGPVFQQLIAEWGKAVGVDLVGQMQRRKN